MSDNDFCREHARYHRPGTKAAIACQKAKSEHRQETHSQVLINHVSYRRGARDFVFHATVPVKGRDSKHVEVIVPTEFLRKLGANLNDPRIQGHGHALWHVMNPERETPCSSCSPEEEKRALARSNAVDAEVAPPKLTEGRQS